ncbi:MAG: serine/threonine protein kinase [Candidatus Abyssobacteria bacterium SURF_17]|uniref:non-specific serine/threonine protein kinase n=1 Tax=Candidatus Abyssobacteria bacterium SURF_17 TaxID=2093361 RepID=A0A419F4Q8_9BACT|nr:MAG: serine/threonine protein kinase [Candidatus Abyssubacteria bacterium SURF_17]
MIGRQIGNYRILKELGKGGMGVVYKANQLTLGRMVAMKVLPQHLTSDSTFIKRFENEARAVAKLNHPNIVQIYDIGHEGEIYYYTMEFIEGPPLDEIIYKEGFLPLDKALSTVFQVAKALQYAHSQGIIHRDIKPSNVMKDKSGQVKVTDFGLALQERVTRLTMEGSIVGTPEYMSPEQAVGQVASARSDIYSLGVVLYELLTGKVPFEGESALMILNKIQTSEPEWPRSINPAIPPEVEAVIRKMMAKNPRDRYGSCQELIQDLRRLKAGQPITPKTARFGSLGSRVPLAAFVVLGTLLIFGMLYYRRASPWVRSETPPSAPPSSWVEMLTQVNDEAASVDGRLKEIWQQCEGDQADTINAELDQAGNSLEQLGERLENLRLQGEETHMPKPYEALIGRTRTNLSSLQVEVARIRQECRPSARENPVEKIRASLSLIEEQSARIRKQCEEEDTAALTSTLAVVSSEIDSVKKELTTIKTPSKREEILSLKDELAQVKQKAASPEEQLKNLEEHMWPDKLVLKNGNALLCEITNEWLDKIRIRKAGGQGEIQADIARSDIELTAYATDVEKQIAKALRHEVPRARDGLREIRNELASLEQKLASPQGESVRIPLVETLWKVEQDCAKGVTVTFKDNMISITSSETTGISTCTTTVSTVKPVETAVSSLEILAQIRYASAGENERASTSLIVSLSDGNEIEYPIFDSRVAHLEAEEVQNTGARVRIRRPENLIAANTGWHVLRLPVGEDIARIEGDGSVAAIQMVHNHAGPVVEDFTSRMGALTLNTL